MPLSRQLAVLDAPSEAAFDRILMLAAEVFAAADCAIMIPEGDRTWVRMSGGKMSTSTGSSSGRFTRLAMAKDDGLFVGDAAADPRFRDHPRVAGPPHTRFYFGAPLLAADGSAVGALAVMDDRPHDAPTPLQRRLLRHFAAEVMTHIQARTHQYLGEQLRESQALLRRSEAHLSRAQQLAEVGSGEVDWIGGNHYWSEQMYRIFGMPAGAPIPSAPDLIRDIVHPDDRAKVRDHHERQKAGDYSQQCEYRIVRSDGDVRTILRFGEVITDAEGRPTRNLIAIQDVTELRKAEQARDEYLQQLHHAQRLDALGTLAGGIAHDLNNTLVPIIALTKLMRAGALREDDRRNLEVIQHAGERARDLVQQVLAFSCKAPMDYRRIDLSSTIADSLRLLRAGLDERIALTERLNRGAVIYADPGQIHQVVVNLVTNAAQAIGGREGNIAVTLDPGSMDAFRLVVSDDGVGMDSPTLSRMFEPFFTTRPVGAGAGLGLSIVHGIVTGHGGTVTGSSIPGSGTSIVVELPSHYRGDEAATQAMAAA
jgi:PAS domain S-box-containing protein